MLTAEAIRDTIQRAYATRQSGTIDEMAQFWAPDATFRLTGDPRSLGNFPVGPTDARTAVSYLMERFTFHEMEPIQMLIDGQRASIHWKVRLTPAGSDEVVTTEIADFLTFDEAGRITSLVEFADTGAIGAMAAAGLF